MRAAADVQGAAVASAGETSAQRIRDLTDDAGHELSLLDAGLAVWPPLEQPTSADSQPRVPIAAARRRFTAFPSFMRRPIGAAMGASTDLPCCYRSQFRPRPK